MMEVKAILISKFERPNLFSASIRFQQGFEDVQELYQWYVGYTLPHSSQIYSVNSKD